VKTSLKFAVTNFLAFIACLIAPDPSSKRADGDLIAADGRRPRQRCDSGN